VVFPAGASPCPTLNSAVSYNLYLPDKLQI